LSEEQLDLLFDRKRQDSGEKSPRQSAPSESQPGPANDVEKPSALREYAGAIHIHTRYSDGSGDIDRVVTAAKKCGIDFIIISDHNSIKHKLKGREGWQDNVLVLVGQEISPKKNHYLALGLDERIKPHRNDLWRHVAQVQEKGGFGFAAHPISNGRRLGQAKVRPWVSLDDERIGGIELWSYMIDWACGLSRYDVKELIRRIKNPAEAIRGPSDELILEWDRLTRKRRMPVIGGIDAHAKRYFFGRLTIFPYEFLFKTIRTHILAPAFDGTLQTDKLVIYEALREGRCFIAYDQLYPANGFNFKCVLDDHVWNIGRQFPFQPGMRLEIVSPREADLWLIKNGAVVHKSTDRKLIYPIHSPGVYRVKAALNHKPWIYSNPLYIRHKTDV